MAQHSRREKYFFHNTLAILLQAVQRQRTTVDLRNEASIFGTVEHADAYMNVVMRDCVFTDPRGDSFKYDMFFVQARNIRCVHIPPHIRMIPAIKGELKQLRGPAMKDRDTKYSNFKAKRTHRMHQEDLTAVQQIIGGGGKADAQESKNE